jgi:hypothetical protein
LLRLPNECLMLLRQGVDVKVIRQFPDCEAKGLRQLSRFFGAFHSTKKVLDALGDRKRSIHVGKIGSHCLLSKFGFGSATS